MSSAKPVHPSDGTRPHPCEQQRRRVLIRSPRSRASPAPRNRLSVAGVEVIPLVTSTAPVIIRSPVVGLVVRILGLLVVEAGSLLVITSLGVEGRSLLLLEQVRGQLRVMIDEGSKLSKCHGRGTKIAMLLQGQQIR